MKGGRGGFTLIEVVIAMAILAVSAVLLLESHYASLDLTAEAQEIAGQNSLLEAAANFAQIQVIAGEKSGSGDFGETRPGYSYAFIADEVEDEDRSGLFEVNLNLTTPTESREHKFFVYVDALANDATLGRK